MSARPALAALLLCATWGCAGSDGTPADGGRGAAGLLEVPKPDLSPLDETVRRRLEERHAATLALLQRIGDPARAPDEQARELGRAFGELGTLYTSAEFPQAGEAALLNAARLDPGEFRWPYYLGHIYREGGRPAEAIEQLERALAIRPEEPPALCWMAKIHLEQGATVEAEREFRRVLERVPDSAFARHGLGKIALANGEHGEAVRLLSEALELAPEATILHYPLALAYRELGELERAEEHLRLRGELELRPADPWMEELSDALVGPVVFADRGAQAYTKGRFDIAVRAFTRGLQSAPGDPLMLAGLGSALFQTGDLDGALERFRQALERDPDQFAAHHGIGAVLERRGDDAGAERHYRAALEIEPAFSPAHLRLAHCLRRGERRTDALRHYRAVLAVDERHAEARLGEAITLVELGRWAEARASLERAVELLPEQPAFAHALARLLVAAPDDSVRDGRRGMELLARLSRELQNTDMAESIAMGLAEAGRYDEAATWQRRAIEAARQAGRDEMARAMADNLASYEQRRACRTPWRAGDPIYVAPRDAEPAVPERPAADRERE